MYVCMYACICVKLNINMYIQTLQEENQAYSETDS